MLKVHLCSHSNVNVRRILECQAASRRPYGGCFHLAPFCPAHGNTSDAEEHREILYIVVINGTDNRRTLFHGRTARSQTPGKPKTPCFHLSCQESLPGCHQGMAVSQPVNCRGSRRCCSSNRWMNCLELLWLTLGRLRQDKCADPRKDSSVNRGHSLNVSFYRSKDLVFNL